MEFHVSLDGRRDLTGQIYRQLRAAVLDGRLRPGEALPPTRELARRLAVSRNTVAAAYDRLTGEGFAEGRVGAGTYVCATGRGADRAGAPAASPLRPRAVWSGVVPWPPPMERPEYDFRPGLLDDRLFPYRSWRRLMAEALRPGALRAGAGERSRWAADPAGHPPLRAAVARHLALSRSVRAGAADVFVTHGFQQALDLVGRVLLEPGDLVAVEDPGYPPARQLFRTLGARVAGVPVDGEGLRVDALPDEARAVYVTPSHQFPLGMPMSLPRRLALLDWARGRNAVVIEDDYDSEYRYGGRPLEPLQGLDEDGRVIYAGTFSKVLRPVLRLGFLVAPPALHDALRAAKHTADWQGSLPEQVALARFVEEGLLAGHVRRLRHEFRGRHERLLQLLERDFAGLLTPVPTAAGLHVSALLPDGTDDVALARRAGAAGVGLLPLSEFGVREPGAPGLLLGYGGIGAERMEAGLRRLGGVV